MDREAIIKSIYDNIINSGECLIWKGKIINNNRPILNIGKKQLSVRKFLTEYYEKEYNTSKYKVTTSCNNEHCINVNHLIFTSKRVHVTKDDVWKRLLQKSSKQDSCLLWTGMIVNGYGQSSVDAKGYSVHKISFWIHNKFNNLEDIPQRDESGNRYVIRHLCNKKLCFNPEHLSLGNDYDNLYTDKSENKTLPRGENNPLSKLTEDIVRKIKESKYPQDHDLYKSLRERAKLFNVSPNTISRIDNNISWGYLFNDESKLETRRDNDRKRRFEWKNKEWDDEMWSKAKSMLERRSKISDYNNEYTGTQCHIWQGKQINGYGNATIHYKSKFVHVLACEIKHKKEKPENMIVRHLCHNRLCCNPDHLEFSTQSVNIIDTIINKRRNLKITPEIVMEIRETKNKDGLTIKQREEKYGIKKSTLSAIELNQIWKHI
jgi:hypothetical protein